MFLLRALEIFSMIVVNSSTLIMHYELLIHIIPFIFERSKKSHERMRQLKAMHNYKNKNSTT